MVATDPGIHRTALRLAHQFQRSVHDLIHVAVSPQRGLRFWHADSKLDAALAQESGGSPAARLRYFAQEPEQKLADRVASFSV